MKCPGLPVTTVLCVWLIHLCHSQEPFAGPYQIAVYQIGQCDKSGTNQVYTSSTRISKVSRTKYVYSGNVTTEVDLNDDMTIFVDAAIWGNGGWRPHYFEAEFPKFCSTSKNVFPVLYQVFKEILHADCPVPAGTYEMKEFDINQIKVLEVFPSLPYGRYRVDFTLMSNGTIVGCIAFYMNVLPPPRSRSSKKNRNPR